MLQFEARDLFERIAELTTAEELSTAERFRAIKSLATSAISSIDHPPPAPPPPPPKVNDEGLGRAQRWMIRRLEHYGMARESDLRNFRWGTLQATRKVLEKLVDRGLVWTEEEYLEGEVYRLTAAGRVLANQLKGQ